MYYIYIEDYIRLFVRSCEPPNSVDDTIFVGVLTATRLRSIGEDILILISGLRARKRRCQLFPIIAVDVLLR
jgi:hypothetical protein